MNLLLLFLLAFGLGFVAAIPFGGSQIELAKRAIQGRLLSAQMVVLGSVTSDIVYGIIALFGIAPFMERPGVMAAFNGIGAALLWGLAFLTFKESKISHALPAGSPSPKSERQAYLTGFALAFSNPPMILTWLMGVTMAKQFGLASPLSGLAKALFILGGALGLGTYLGSLAAVIFRFKHFVPTQYFGRVYRYLAALLLVLSLYFILGFIRYFRA